MILECNNDPKSDSNTFAGTVQSKKPDYTLILLKISATFPKSFRNVAGVIIA